MLRAVHKILILFPTLLFLLHCERSRLQPPERTEEMIQEAHAPLDMFLKDPQLPIELCWQGEASGTAFRLQCWHERLPGLSCWELVAVESLTHEVALTYSSGSRRLFERGWQEQVSVSEDGQTWQLHIVFESSSLALKATEEASSSGQMSVKFFELERRGAKQWHPWVSLGGEEIEGWRALTDFLTCSSPEFL